MRKFRRKNITCWILALCVLNLLCVFPALAQDQSGTPPTGTTNSQTSSPTTKEKKKSKKVKGETASAGNANASETTASGSSSSTVKKSGSPSGAAPESDIAAARTSGKVWVNLDSGIYHKGGRWYGKTNNGRFMTEKEAKAAGYKPAQRN